MRVLVTGGAGLIGSHIVDLVLGRGHEVVVLDSLDPQTHPGGKPCWVPDEVRFIHGDVRNADDLRTALSGVRQVYHQAAFGGFTTEISRYIDSNAVGTARLFEVIAEDRLPVEKVVVASSQAVYGEGAYLCAEHGPQFPPPRSTAQLREARWEPRCPVCGTELAVTPTPTTAPFTGHTPYALSKMVQERLSLSTGQRYDIPTVALRYAITYGPRQSLFNPYTGVVSIFSTRLLNGLRPVLYEDGRQIRDFINVADVARANLHVMDDPNADFRVFNVGSGRPVRMRELAELLAMTYNRDLAPELLGEFRPGDARHIVHDTGDLREAGFVAETTLEQGIARYVEWIGEQGEIREYFSAAEAGLRAVGVVQGGAGRAG